MAKELSLSIFSQRFLVPDYDLDLRRVIVLEAALFFTLPAWILTVNPTWPGAHPFQFVLALLTGASAAFLFCHLIPAICEPAIAILGTTYPGRVLLFGVSVWLSIGAAAALFEVANIAGSMLVLYRHLPVGAQTHRPWGWIAQSIAVLCVLLSLVVTTVPRLCRVVAWLSLGAGLSLGIGSLVAQYDAVYFTNPQMQSEDALRESPMRIAGGMLLASAPAAIIALRIGRMRPSLSQVVAAGFWGVWLPAIASTALISVGKMLGARLHWKPSLPLDFTWAFVWISAATDQTAVFLWPLAVTCSASLLISAMWVTDISRNWARGWRRTVMLISVGFVGYRLQSPTLWDSATQSWLCSIVIASIALGTVHSFNRVRRLLAVRRGQ